MRRRKPDTAMLGVILTLAWPTMLEQLMQTAVQYIDTAMVGSLGTSATAAVGATSTVNWLVNSSLSALGVGFLAFIARALGAGEAKRARRAAMQAVLAVLCMGSLFTAVTLSLSGVIPALMQVEPAIRSLASAYFFILYVPMLPRAASIIFGTVLRAAGDTRAPMKTGVVVNLVNVVLNFLFIYPAREATLLGLRVRIPGAGWGVLGAAAASAIAYTVGGVIMTARLWRHPRISPRGERIRPDAAILRPCLRVAVPNMLQRFGTSLGYVAFASMINALGEVATAAHTIANTVESAFYIPGYGMQTAAATLTGNAYGARDRERMRSLSAMLIPIARGRAPRLAQRGRHHARCDGAAHGRRVRAVLRLLHHRGGHDAGRRAHARAVPVQHRGHVAGAHCRHVPVHALARAGAGERMGLHDRA